ncbi:MAG: hypothetical protein ABII18_01625 [bacterium]|nr:hypothetical protein [bacterium]MBU1916882.1 hypothetical protein [bacterium]
MKSYLRYILPLFIILLLVSCSGATRGGQADIATTGVVDTIVLNSKKSIKSVFCNFPDKIYTLEAVFPIPEEGALPESNKKYAKHIREILQQMSREKNVVETNLESGWSVLESFGLVVANAIYDKSPLGFTTEEQSIILDEAYNFLDTQDKWTLTFSTYGDDSDYKKIYFVRTNTNTIQGVYIYKIDDEGEPEKGMLVFVNPKGLEGVLNNGRRLLVLAFDFTNPLENLLVVKFDRVSTGKGSLVGQVFMQCDEIMHDCIVEHQEINTTVPVRELSIPLIRYEWMEETEEICLASMDYRLGSIEPKLTFEYDLETYATEVDACAVETPVWGEHVFTQKDLLIRYDDTKPFGGTVKEIYIDGVSKSGWEAYLTPERIDSLLNPGGE